MTHRSVARSIGAAIERAGDDVVTRERQGGWAPPFGGAFDRQPVGTRVELTAVDELAVHAALLDAAVVEHEEQVRCEDR